MSEPFSWKCPFCNHDTTITTDYEVHELVSLTSDNVDGPRVLYSQFVVCPNKTCKKFSLTVSLYERYLSGGGWRPGKLLKKWRLVPPSSARVFPDYIPRVIIDDYTDTCSIADLSPKASATLARRCLQGMIRDFWGIKKSNLAVAITALRGKVSDLTWKAIDSVRSLGNIGAHMEKDINLLIDVDPGEAEKLIWLIEYLLEDWYIRRHDQEERLKEVVEIADAKEEQRKKAKTNQAAAVNEMTP